MADATHPSGPADGRLRAHARERLARELHDELAHRVTGISLQVMGHRSSDDAAQLRSALDTIAAATADVLAHLWLLDRVLRAHPYEQDECPGDPGEALPHLAVCDPVAAVVEREARTLRESGFRVEVVVPLGGDHIGPLARQTLDDAVAAARATIERHAPPGAGCRIEVAGSRGSVSLLVTVAMAPLSAEPDHPALVALHERVRLTEGAYWAGLEHHGESPTWSLSLRLRDR